MLKHSNGHASSSNLNGVDAVGGMLGGGAHEDDAGLLDLPDVGGAGGLEDKGRL